LGVASLLLSQLGSGLDHLERRALGRVHPRRPVRAAARACDRFGPDLDQLLEAASAALAPELVDRHEPDGSRAVSRVERSTYTPVGRDPWGVDRPAERPQERRRHATPSGISDEGTGTGSSRRGRARRGGVSVKAVRTKAELRQALEPARRAGRTIGL